MNIAEYPKPIIVDSLSPSPGRRRHTAGSKERRVFCGRKTYRFIGNKAVCSFCSATEDVKNIGPNWSSKIIRKEETYAEN